jgi:tRNA-dihydrouridine synthase C
MILLAPMEGVLDPILRDILTGIGGIDRAATEFIRVTSLLLPEHVLLRYAPELNNGGKTSSGTPVFLQFLGGQPGPMADNAAQAAAMGAPGIDLNFGCPAKTVNRHDGGAALLKNPERVRDVTEAVRRAVPIHVPVTAKVRLGFDHKDFVTDIARAAEAGGAASLTVHARTRAEMYKPPAHWEYIARMREAVKIPVIANGDIWSVADYWRCRDISGCASVALGRGLVACPDLALQIHLSKQGEQTREMPWSVTARHLARLFVLTRLKSDRLAIARVKQWCKLLSRQYGEAAKLFENIKILTHGDLILLELNKETPWLTLQSTPGQFAPTA